MKDERLNLFSLDGKKVINELFKMNEDRITKLLLEFKKENKIGYDITFSILKDCVSSKIPLKYFSIMFMLLSILFDEEENRNSERTMKGDEFLYDDDYINVNGNFIKNVNHTMDHMKKGM